MTRIVAGRAGGRRLKVAADGTRPTSDRVREALFSSLEALVDLTGVRVLDLFAGTGAVGLEALSRGAAAATMVDSGRPAVELLRRNAAVVDLPGADVRPQSVEAFLADSAPSAPFDMVFVDPPYAYDDDALAAILADLGAPDRWLSEGAVIVVERSSRSAAPTWPAMIEPIKNKRYGETVLWYGRHGEETRT